jgi:hypothetical protein
MTSVYVTNVVRKVEVTPGYTAGSGGGGTGTNILPLNNSWTGTNTFAKASAFNPDTSSTIPIAVKGASGQSSALTTWRDSSNNLLASVDNVGQIMTNTNVFVGSGGQTGGANKAIVFSNGTAPTSSYAGGGQLYVLGGNLQYRNSLGAIYVPVPANGSKGQLLAHTGTGWVQVTAGSDGQVLSANSATASGVSWITGGGSGSGHQILSSGTPYAQRSKLNFIGATVADDSGNDRTNVTITSGANYQTVKSVLSPVTARPALSFGSGFTVTDSSPNNQTEITLPSSATNASAGTPALRSLGTGTYQAAPGLHFHASDYDPINSAANAISAHNADASAHSGLFITQENADLLYASGDQTADLVGGSTGEFLKKNSNADYDYVWASGGTSTLALPYVATSVSDTVPLTIVGSASQSANLMEFKDNSSNTLAAISWKGAGWFGDGFTAAPNAQVRIRPYANSNVALAVQRAGDNTSGDLIAAYDDAASKIFRVTGQGKIVATNYTPLVVHDTVADAQADTTLDVGTVVLVRT